MIILRMIDSKLVLKAIYLIRRECQRRTFNQQLLKGGAQSTTTEPAKKQYKQNGRKPKPFQNSRTGGKKPTCRKKPKSRPVQLEDLESCKICMEPYDSSKEKKIPRTLKCTHAFCTECILKLIKASPSKSRV